MKTFATCMAILLLGVSAAPIGAQQVVLQANFDGDTVGQEPDKTLPGGPAGDSLRLWTSGGDITVVDHYGVMSNQPLQLHRKSLDTFGANFLVDPDFKNCGVYTIRWTSMLLTSVQFFYFNFVSPNSRVLGSVGFRPNGQMTASGSQNVLATVYTPGTPQQFEVRIDIVNQTMDVIIDGVPDPQGQGLRPVQAGGTGLIGLAPAFGMTDMYSVILDDLEVTAESCPGVATEPVSWSALKAQYR